MGNRGDGEGEKRSRLGYEGGMVVRLGSLGMSNAAGGYVTRSFPCSARLELIVTRPPPGFPATSSPGTARHLAIRLGLDDEVGLVCCRTGV